MNINYILYGIFVLFLIISMWWDYRQHKQDKAVSIKSALWETAFRVAVATIFGSVVRLFRGSESTIQYFSGYLLEKSLSVDNLFVMIAIFSSFHIPEKYRHRVLYFGILGAIILRLIFISLGTALLSLGDWVLAVFGLIVLVTAIKMVIEERKKHISSHTRGRKHLEEKPWDMDYSKGGIANFVTKFFPVSSKIEGHDFFVKKDGKWYVTALFLALIVIEISDLLFAFDSIPAILSISQDVFIVFSSNIFAILGLRALYFVLEAMGNKFPYVNYAVIGILCFIGVKMLLSFLHIHIGSRISLAVIVGALAIGIGVSILQNKKKLTS